MRKELLDKLIQDKDLPKLCLANMAIRDEEIQELFEAIRRLNPLAHAINLDNNQIGDKGARILSKHLKTFKQLAELSLQFNAIGKKGALNVFSLKKIFPHLDILFHGNKIFDAAEMLDIERLALQ